MGLTAIKLGSTILDSAGRKKKNIGLKWGRRWSCYKKRKEKFWGPFYNLNNSMSYSVNIEKTLMLSKASTVT